MSLVLPHYTLRSIAFFLLALIFLKIAYPINIGIPPGTIKISPNAANVFMPTAFIKFPLTYLIGTFILNFRTKFLLIFPNRIKMLGQKLNANVMSKLMKNLLVGGVFSAQTPYTSGEILDIKGADISDLKTGKAPVNTEHINPEDVKEANKDPKVKGFEGFQTIVGRVVTAKKIFSEADCENEQEKRAWNNLKVPLIWGILEIFDDADHPNAKAAAAIIKSYHNAGVDQLLGYSVEGATLKRDGKHLLETCIRKIALTAKPCNKASKVEFIQDSPAGVSKSMNEQTVGAGIEPLYKTAYNSQVYILEQPKRYKMDDHGLANALKGLKKTIEAGGGNAAPSALTAGSVLQKESELGKLLRVFKKMKPSKQAIRKHCPTLSEEDLEKVEAVLMARFEEDTLKLTQGIYSDLTKKH